MGEKADMKIGQELGVIHTHQYLPLVDDKLELLMALVLACGMMV